MTEPRRESAELYGVLVTFRRQATLAHTLQKILEQSRPPGTLVVIDNEGSAETAEIVGEFSDKHRRENVKLVVPGTNLGPAGGWADGMERILAFAQPTDWIVTFDDNNPPETLDELNSVFQLAIDCRNRNPQIAGVGVAGAGFNWRSGYLNRIPDDQLSGAVPVDYLAGGHLSMYSVDAMRQVGSFRRELFFGYVEVELGLRLRRAGYDLVAHGSLWKERRKRHGREGVSVRPSPKCSIHWQRYYRIRNYIAMMKSFGRIDLSVRWAIIQCCLKPLYSALHSPRLGLAGFRQALHAASDGFRGRMGRTLEPPSGPPKRDYELQTALDQ